MRRDWRGWISKSCGCPHAVVSKSLSNCPPPGLTAVHQPPWYARSRCPPPWYARSMPSGCQTVYLTHVDHHDVREIAIWKQIQSFEAFLEDCMYWLETMAWKWQSLLSKSITLRSSSPLNFFVSDWCIWKHCQRHNGTRVLSLKLHCSLNEYKFNSVKNII